MAIENSQQQPPVENIEGMVNDSTLGKLLENMKIITGYFSNIWRHRT